MAESLPARADVSVVVVARGDEPGLTDALRSVLAALDHVARGGAHPGGWLRGERLGGEVVLVVHDLGALPPAARADARVRVVAAPGTGDGRARNIGVAAARGRYLLFTEPDARVPRGWVAGMTEPLRTGRADLVGGAVRLADQGPARLDDATAAAYLDVVPDPPEVGRAFSGVSAAATRAVLEAVGFDESLGTARYPYTVDVVFRRDVIGAGFRESAVAGVPVERYLPPGALGRRPLVARARAHGRGAAYLDRHARESHPAALPTLIRLAGRVLLLAWLTARRARPSALLPAHAAVAHHRELLRLRRAPYRQPPRSAAGDVPGGAGAPRAAAPVALVPRDSVPPTPLPPAPAPEGGASGASGVSGAAGVAGGPVAPAASGASAAARDRGLEGRGAVADFWTAGLRHRAAS